MEKIVGEGEKFERIRRVTGYLAGDVSRFNNGKRAEERDRVKHGTEGLSGRFTSIDRAIYGKIKGVTDREYYTNSFHVPVYYNISITDKIKREAPFHALTNAGHISYIEMDGDLTENVEAFEKVIRLMKESGIGYGAINHPVDRDPVCGYVGIIKDVCPGCGRREFEPIPAQKLQD